jgi:hypothetical protein
MPTCYVIFTFCPSSHFGAGSYRIGTEYYLIASQDKLIENWTLGIFELGTDTLDWPSRAGLHHAQVQVLTQICEGKNLTIHARSLR